MSIGSTAYEQAERKRVHGSVIEALELYQAAIADEQFKTDDPVAYLHALEQGCVVARLNEAYELAAEWEELTHELAGELNEPTYRFLRDSAERLRKQGVGLAKHQRGEYLAEARRRLEASAAEMRQTNGPLAEICATNGHLVRLLVSEGELEEALDLSVETFGDLKTAGNPHYQLYQGLDHVELMLWFGRGWKVGWTALRQLLYTSWRYGNVWGRTVADFAVPLWGRRIKVRLPRPRHTGRAAFNLLMCCLPLDRRRQELKLQGRLMSTQP